MATETREVARRQQAGQLATDVPANPWASVGLLKPHAGGMVQDTARVDALATVSAGYKNNQGYPERSRDGTIYVHDQTNRAAGLKAILREREGKSLTIALVSNNVGDVLQQRFSSYSQTRLLAYGDERQITLIHVRDTGQKDRRGNPITESERETVTLAAEPQRYAQIAADMKVQTSLYFALAEWTEDRRPRLIFPDGLGLYRLRFTSLNSAEAIKGQLAYIASLTDGRVAGIPLELSIDYREVSGSDGSRRTVPVWTLVLNPPGGLALEAREVAGILESGIEQASSLRLAPPRPETVDVAAAEEPDVDLDEPGVIEGAVVRRPHRRDDTPIANRDRFRAEYAAATRGTSLADGEGREAFLLAATHGRTGDLETFIAEATNADAAKLLERAARHGTAEVLARMDSAAPTAPRQKTSEEQAQSARRVRTYDEMFGDGADDPGAPSPLDAPRSRGIASVTPEVHQAALLTGAPAPVAAAPAAPARPEHGGEYSPDEWREFYRVWSAELRSRDSAYVVWPDSQIKRASVGQLIEETMSCIGQCDSIDEAIYLTDLDDAREDEQPAETDEAF